MVAIKLINCILSVWISHSRVKQIAPVLSEADLVPSKEKALGSATIQFVL